MADQKISLKWAGRGDIRTDNITPVGLKPIKKSSYGRPDFDNIKAQSFVIEGDNAPVMKSLCAGAYRLRGNIDLMLWDPPYNTGKNDFIYDDDFYLTKKEAAKLRSKYGTVSEDRASALWVKEKDASRHTKWLSFMEVRLELAKKLLRKSGVIAIHISYQELFRLGLLMDEVFGEENRLGIINWECAYSPKNDNEGIPSTTDYILIYAKDKSQAYRGTLPRTASMDAHYGKTDGDTREWRSGDFSASSGTDNYFYGIENPLTEEMHYPPQGGYWRRPNKTACEILSQWGVKYEINGKGDCVVKKGEDRKQAAKKQKAGPWPVIYFGATGKGRPTLKRYKDKLRNEGRVIGTYWEAAEVLDEQGWEEDEVLDVSLRHELSGHNDEAKKLMKAVLGPDCPFDTPKPVRLTERVLEMFCPKGGTVLDAFGGSATTAHAVLNLNSAGAKRRFIIIERGSNKYGYADTITAERIRRVIDGDWVTPRPDTKATGGSFVYLKAGARISGEYIMESKREELADIILTSHAGSVALDELAKKPKYIIGHDEKQRAIALVWDSAKGAHAGRLTIDKFHEILAETKAMKLSKPVFIYAISNEGPNGSASYTFHQIPDEILAALEIMNLTE